MADQDLPPYTEHLARQWRALAERRRRALLEIYRSGRWRLYYTEEQLTALMRDAERDIGRWRALAGEPANDDAVAAAPAIPPLGEAAE